MNLPIEIIKDFLQMGGYAPYVWSAYSLVVITLYINILFTQHCFKRVVSQVQDSHYAPKP